MSNRKTRLLTFGGGFSRYRRAARRLATEARHSGLFHSVEPNTEHDLRRDHAEFVERNARILSRDVRGYGYWIWKPHLIQAALQPSVQYLLYLDAGAVLNLTSARSRRRLEQYYEIADANGIAVMHNNYEEQEWCKADTLERIGLHGPGRSSGQAEAGFLLIRNSSSTREFIRTWLELCSEDNYRFIDDSPSQLPNATGFHDHRHDQAILSCLCKVSGIEMLPPEMYFPGTWTTDGADSPIWQARHLWGTHFDPTGAESIRRRFEGHLDRAETWWANRQAWSAPAGESVADQQKLNRGSFADNWATTHVTRFLPKGGQTLVLRGRLPIEYRQLNSQRLSVWCDDELLLRRALIKGSFEWKLQLPERTRHSDVQIRIRASRSFMPKQLKLNDDVRRLAYYLDELARHEA